MAKVTITIEDTANGFEVDFDDLNPGVSFEQAQANPTRAEDAAFKALEAILKAQADTVPLLTGFQDDQEYHSQESTNV